MSLLSVILPVFALIALGVAARRGGLVDAAGLRGLTDVVFFLAMPALLFGAIVQGPPGDLLGVAGVYFCACLIVFALGVAIARLLRLPLAHAGMLGLDSSYGNTVMMGIPIALAALGPEALPPLMAIIALHSAILLPLAGMLVEADGGTRQRPLAMLGRAVQGMLRNPVIMAMPVAFAWRTLGLPVPVPLKETLHLLGAAAVPLALICLGGALPAPKLGAAGLEAAIGTVLKLAVLPALVWVIGSWAGLPALPLSVAVLTGGMPTGANAFLLARRVEHLMEISATTVVVSTLLSLLSLTALLRLIL